MYRRNKRYVTPDETVIRRWIAHFTSIVNRFKAEEEMIACPGISNVTRGTYPKLYKVLKYVDNDCEVGYHDALPIVYTVARLDLIG